MKTNRLILALPVLLTGGLAALAQGPTKPTPSESDRASTAVTEESIPRFVRSVRGTNVAIRLLEKRVESVDWNDAPLADVLNWLKEEGEGQVNIAPRWKALSVENVTPDSLVTLQVADTTVAEALSEVVDQLTEDGEVTFHAMDNLLTISTKADFNRQMFVKMYDATDVLFRAPNMGSSAPKIDLQNQQRSGGAGGGGGGGQGVFSGGGQGGGQEENVGGQQEEQQLEQRLERLREKITRTIAPESWDTGQAGATGRGRIEVYNTFIIVYNTIEVHEMIGGYFAFERVR
jgi:hypothetical protein